MKHWVDVGRTLQVGVFAALVVVALRLWRRQGEVAAARLAASFGLLAVVALDFWLLPDTGWQWARKLGVAAALLYPLLLHWFAVSFRRPSSTRRSFAVASTVVVVVWAFALPSIPSPGSAEPSGYAVFVVAVVVQWAVLSLAVAGRLWTAGHGLATVARRRMRTLSLGSGLLASVVLFAGLAGPRQHPALDFSLELVSLAAALLFLVGFAPPAMLRTTWRRREGGALRQAELRAMTATTAEEVASPLVEPIARMLGGSGALLADPGGRVVAAHGLEPGEAADTAARLAAAAAPGPWFRGGVLALPLRAGWLAVHASPYAPVFGGGEIALLQRLGLFNDPEYAPLIRIATCPGSPQWQGKTVAESPVKVETDTAKFSTNSVRLSGAEGSRVLSEIRVGGTRTRLVFDKTGDATN